MSHQLRNGSRIVDGDLTPDFYSCNRLHPLLRHPIQRHSFGSAWPERLWLLKFAFEHPIPCCRDDLIQIAVLRLPAQLIRRSRSIRHSLNGSPARRPPSITGIFRPVIALAARITSGLNTSASPELKLSEFYAYEIGHVYMVADPQACRNSFHRS